MRSFFNKLEKIFAGVAFAEAGDFETARRITGMPPSPSQASLSKKLEDLMTAVTFAEANCHDTARMILKGKEAEKKQVKPSFTDAIGLTGIRIWYGVAEVA